MARLASAAARVASAPEFIAALADCMSLATSLAVAATCRMHGLDLFAYLAEVCTASMADLAVPQLLPATA